MKSIPSRPSRPIPARRHVRGLARPAQLALLSMGSVILVYANTVAAVGVGEPRALSHLFEPLFVEVPVDTRGLDPAAIRVGVTVGGAAAETAASLAPALRREWRVDEAGQPVLRISADTPIVEPLLTLQLEIGDDRVSTEHDLTLLFDPAPALMPTATTAAPATVDAAAAAAAAADADRDADAATDTGAAIVAAVPEPAAVSPRAPQARVAATAAAAVATDHPTEALSLRAGREPARLVLAAASAVAPVVTTTAEPAIPVASVAKAIVAEPVAAAAAGSARIARLQRLKPVSSPRVGRLMTITPAFAVASTEAADTAVANAPQPMILDAAERRAQIASTLRPQALSAADRWQRTVIAPGESTEQLAARLRGGENTLPLSLVATLVRWLNPRAFDGAFGEPLAGAQLRFPQPESLAAQIAASGGVWTLADAQPAAVAAVPTTPASIATEPAVADPLIALGAAAGIAARSPAGLAGRAVPVGLRLGSGVLGGAVAAGLLSVLALLVTVFRTPLPARTPVPAGIGRRQRSALTLEATTAAPFAAASRASFGAEPARDIERG